MVLLGAAGMTGGAGLFPASSYHRYVQDAASRVHHDIGILCRLVLLIDGHHPIVAIVRLHAHQVEAGLETAPGLLTDQGGWRELPA